MYNDPLSVTQGTTTRTLVHTFIGGKYELWRGSTKGRVATNVYGENVLLRFEFFMTACASEIIVWAAEEEEIVRR